MVYYRNNPEDKNLCLVASSIRDVITNNTESNSKILVQVLEENIPVLYLGKLDRKKQHLFMIYQICYREYQILNTGIQKRTCTFTGNVMSVQ
ncbi:MAG: hypothetical protein HFH68_15045 [Lachnospiraceae bacterium]|nr:hypothetical protein [Lachnospiraceae bacterium]